MCLISFTTKSCFFLFFSKETWVGQGGKEESPTEEEDEGEELVENEEAAVAIQINLNLVEVGNVQPKSGMMEMIFVSLRNQG